jgi:hypothetical protein
MRPVVYHAKGIYWASLHNNSSEKDKIRTSVSTFVLLAVGCNATCSDSFLGSSIHPLPHMSSWHNAELAKHGNKFNVNLRSTV